MSSEKKQIVFKRVSGRHHGGGHSGGGWKIAYADFMTAMMAFFLVMWLLSSATPKQLVGVAEHFKMPLKVALQGGPRSSTSSNVIPGGGPDPVHKQQADARQPDAGPSDEDEQALQDMKDRLEELIRNSPIFQQFRSQLLVDITTEGLRLQIVDNDNRPMFELASARMAAHLGAILRELAPMLKDWPNKITLSGHTDSTPYAGGMRSYSNWELSADRANASRRELAAGGLPNEKILRVMGLSDSMHLDKDDPRSPMNRRISIIVLNSATQQRIEQENSNGGPAAVASPRGIPAAPGLPAPAITPNGGQPAGAEKLAASAGR